MIDFATVIPIWITYYCFDNPVDVDEIKDAVDVLNYILHGAYTLRILRVLRVHKTLNLIEDEVHRFLWQLALSVITMILFGLLLLPPSLPPPPLIVFSWQMLRSFNISRNITLKPNSILGCTTWSVISSSLILCFSSLSLVSVSRLCLSLSHPLSGGYNLYRWLWRHLPSEQYRETDCHGIHLLCNYFRSKED
jgi:hypothetical protein